MWSVLSDISPRSIIGICIGSHQSSAEPLMVLAARPATQPATQPFSFSFLFLSGFVLSTQHDLHAGSHCAFPPLFNSILPRQPICPTRPSIDDGEGGDLEKKTNSKKKKKKGKRRDLRACGCLRHCDLSILFLLLFWMAWSFVGGSDGEQAVESSARNPDSF